MIFSNFRLLTFEWVTLNGIMKRKTFQTGEMTRNGDKCYERASLLCGLPQGISVCAKGAGPTVTWPRGVAGHQETRLVSSGGQGSPLKPCSVALRSLDHKLPEGRDLLWGPRAPQCSSAGSSTSAGWVNKEMETQGKKNNATWNCLRETFLAKSAAFLKRSVLKARHGPLPS